MRRTIANLIEATRLNFGTQAAPASPATSTRNPSKTAAKDLPMSLFAKSPLASRDGLTPAEIDNVIVLFADAAVQRAAGRLSLKRQRVAEMAGYRSAIAEALAAAGDVGSATPQQVVAIIGRLADAAEEELVAVREDHAAHDAIRKARRDQLAPLTAAVNVLHSRLAAERDTLLRHLDATARHIDGAGGVARQRHDLLAAAGFKADEIGKLDLVRAEEPATKAAQYRARLAEINVPLEKCRAYSSDPRRSVAHLEGLGFDDLITKAYPDALSAEAAA